MADVEALPLGRVLEGKYRLEQVIGGGGMGVVYSATHLMLQKRVAVKVLLPQLASDRDIVSRVIQEARTASATGHPNVVAVTDMGYDGAVPFMVMELLEGQSLADVLQQKGRMSPENATTVLMQVLEALEAVHALGVVHRDLKPANVMIAKGPKGKPVVKVLDFGISKVLKPEATQPTTGTGKIMGTPRHMAPEQALGVDVDHRADLHAAGSLLYTLLTANPPFEGPSTTATLARVLEGSYVPATEIIPSLPAGLEAVLAKSMAVKRERRYATAAQMREALRPFARPTSDVPPEPRTPEPPGAQGPPAVDVDASPAQPTLGPVARQAAASSNVSADPWPTAGRATASAAPAAPSRLELDVPADWKAGEGNRSPIRKPPPRRRGGFAWWGWYVVLAALLVGGLAAWRYRAQITEAVDTGFEGVGSTSGENILLLIDTVPKDAFVFVDGVQRDDRPVEIPRSKELIKIRVEADGFEPRIIELEPSRTRRIKVKLDRRRTKRGRK